MVPPDRFFDDPRGDLLLESTDRRFARVQSDVLRREIRSANDWLPDDLQTLPELMPEGTPMLSMQGDAASLQLLLTHALGAEANEQPLAFEHARRCVARSTVRKQYLTFVRYPPRRRVRLAAGASKRDAATRSSRAVTPTDRFRRRRSSRRHRRLSAGSAPL
jgi:hypothetical protein